MCYCVCGREICLRNYRGFDEQIKTSKLRGFNCNAVTQSEMLQLLILILCLMSSDVGESRQLREVKPVGSVVSSVTTPVPDASPDTNSLSGSSSHSTENSTKQTSVNDNNEASKSKAAEAPKPAVKGHDQSPLKDLYSKSGAALRGLYVFVGLSSVVMMYIAVKLIRLRRKKMRIRKYGLIANADDVEMTPLGAEDDDEDTTLFDAHNHIGR